MPSFTQASGSTLDVVGVGDNRIGTPYSNQCPMALPISSVIFLASPKSIMVLAR